MPRKPDTPIYLDDGHQENLERVSARIASVVLQFCRERETFHADDLRRAVIRETGIAAPASADRILRDLRQKRQVIYRCLSRSESLYEVLWTAGDE